MPRPGPRRPYVAARLEEELLAWIDAEAERNERNRSEQMRAMLEFARAKMPKRGK